MLKSEMQANPAANNFFENIRFFEANGVREPTTPTWREYSIL